MPWPKGKPCPEEVKRKISNSLKGRTFSEETRQKISEHHKGLKLSEETKEKIAASKRGKPLSPETCAKMSCARIGNKNSLGTRHSAETLAKLSKIRRGHPVSEATREKTRNALRGANCYNWKGGKSFEPYCPAFNNEVKERTRNAFERRCYLCGREELHEKHHAHHVDYNKSQGCNGHAWGLIPLCRSCHGKTQHNRWRWFALLRDYWIYEYLDFNSNLF